MTNAGQGELIQPAERSDNAPIDDKAKPATLVAREGVIAVGWSKSDKTIAATNPMYVAAVSIWLHADGEPKCISEKAFVLECGQAPSDSTDEHQDLSGVTGLFSPWRRADDRTYHETTERSLSDILTWALTYAFKEAASLKPPVPILLLGPLMHKLRGRIYYQVLDFLRTPLYVITSDADWLARMACRVQDEQGLGDMSEYRWSCAEPDLAIDHGSREYVGCRGMDRVHVLVPSSSVPAAQSHDFHDESHRRLTLLWRINPGASEVNDVEIPLVLLRAKEAAAALQDKYYLAMESVHTFKGCVRRKKGVETTAYSKVLQRLRASAADLALAASDDSVLTRYIEVALKQDPEGTIKDLVEFIHAINH